jgi:uncharacterized protein (TIGR02001 family)
MKKTLLALAAVSALTALPAVSHAEDNPLSFNLSLTSDYRYRGISQTRLKPALQGGADYALPGGFYVGTWLSTIKWIKDFGGGADVEWDLYGGYKGEISKDLGYDVGVLSYQYPSHGLNPSPVTNELYGALTFGPTTLKYSHSVSNLFGFANSKNSGYLDLTATFDVGGGFSLVPHIGYQKVANNTSYSYTDYSLTASKEVAGFTLSGALVGASTKSIGGVKAYASPANGKDLGRSGLVLAVKKTF